MNCSRLTRTFTEAAIIQNMGYYPSGNKFFSNLPH
jgi:hypothetical protein